PERIAQRRILFPELMANNWPSGEKSRLSVARSWFGNTRTGRGVCCRAGVAFACEERATGQPAVRQNIVRPRIRDRGIGTYLLHSWWSVVCARFSVPASGLGEWQSPPLKRRAAGAKSAGAG